MVATVRRTAAGLVERLARLHDVEKQRYQLPRYGTNGAHHSAAVPRQQRFVLRAVEPTFLPPAAGEEEELTPE